MVIWYHFTQRSVVRQILREGLRPRGGRPANDSGIGPHGESLESNPNYVYLTSRKLRPWHGMDYDEAALLVIDSDYLDEKLMREDEDEARFRTAGTMAYEGAIHPDAVIEVWFYEPRKNEQGMLSYVMVEQDFRDWEI